MNYFEKIKLFIIRFNLIKILALLFPIILALYLFNPFDNTINFYWDQSLVLQDKSVFTSSFYFFQERFGFGVYGYYLNFTVYSLFSFLFGPEKGMDVAMILLIQAAFWGMYLFLKEITQSPNKFNLYLLSLIYIVSIETQLNVYRSVISQNFLWGLLPLAAYFTIKVIRNKSLWWQVGLAITLFFFQVSFSHPTSVINYVLIIGLTLLLYLVSGKISWNKLVRIIAINIIVFFPIFLQIALMNKEVSGYIYNSSNPFGGDFVLSWYELGKARFQLSNIFRFNYFLISQVNTDTFDNESLLRISDNKISQALSIYSQLNFINLGIFLIILMPIIGTKKGLLNFKNSLLKIWSTIKTIFKTKIFKSNVGESTKNESKILEVQERIETPKSVIIYTITTFSAFFGVATMAMFQGPLLQFFGLIFKFAPSVFLLYRYLDVKFGAVFLTLILLALASTQNILKSKKTKQFVNIFLIILNIFYLGFFSTKFYISPYSQLEIPKEYAQTCNYLKQNSLRTIKFPYSYDFLHFTEISGQKVLSNDVFNQNCDQPLLSFRTLQVNDELSIIKLYDLMITNPSSFQNQMQNLGIDTLVVDKKFVPNNNWYRIFSEEQKTSLIDQIDVNFKAQKVSENEYFRVYKFSPVQPFYISNGTLEYQKYNPTEYKLKINNITSDTKLEFQYSFGNWSITDPNSKYLLGNSLLANYKGRNYNNTWDIKFKDLELDCPESYCQKNGDGSFNLNLTLWYRPQIIFEELMALFVIIVLGYSSFKLYKKFYVSK